MTSWRRDTNTSYLWQDGSNWLDAIPAGDSYLRVHIRWGFYIDTPIDTDLQLVSTNIMSFGLVTTIGDGSETPPNPRSASGDADPPTQRWIYLETRAPVISAINSDAGVVAWRDSGSTEPSDTRGQVAAVGIPAGDTLNLWASWSGAFSWDAQQANTSVWLGVSILRKN